MRVSNCVCCKDFPCTDVNHQCFIVPDVDINPQKVSIFLISEAAPADSGDYYYADGDPLFQQTVDWAATPYAWLSLPFHFILGWFVALGLARGAITSEISWAGIVYGLLIYLSDILHNLGHIVSSRLAGGPLTTHLFTATFPLTLYKDEPDAFTKWIHIGRALGGPATNFIVGMVAAGINLAVGSHFLGFFTIVNLVVGVWVLLPIPSLDGWVIWGELFGFRKGW